MDSSSLFDARSVVCVDELFSVVSCESRMFGWLPAIPHIDHTLDRCELRSVD